MDDDCCFPKSFVFQRNQDFSQECTALSYLAMSNTTYWIPVTASKKPPTSLLSFKKKSFLSLERLPNDSNWSRVEGIVSQSSMRFGPAVVIKVPKHRLFFRSSSPTELVLVAKDEIERDGCLHTCPQHITPWEVLESRMKAIANSLPVSTLPGNNNKSMEQPCEPQVYYFNRSNLLITFQNTLLEANSRK